MQGRFVCRSLWAISIGATLAACGCSYVQAPTVAADGVITGGHIKLREIVKIARASLQAGQLERLGAGKIEYVVSIGSSHRSGTEGFSVALGSRSRACVIYNALDLDRSDVALIVGPTLRVDLYEWHSDHWAPAALALAELDEVPTGD